MIQVPYAEPTWLTPEFKSPYYSESHKVLQKGVPACMNMVKC